ncbi:hypothetical protein, partial [Streptomyces scabiei]|uniref:hypothetical protein n=1 Tax=Streptomyces scabiei TaxID=1930 RepID=UPI0029BDCE06
RAGGRDLTPVRPPGHPFTIMETPLRSDDPSLDIIREAIEQLIPGATPAHLGLQLTEKNPNRVAVNTWTGTPAGAAERIHTALFGRPRTEAQAARRVTLSRSEALKAITRVLKEPVENVAAADLIYGRALAHVEDPQAALGVLGLGERAPLLGVVGERECAGDLQRENVDLHRPRRRADLIYGRALAHVEDPQAAPAPPAGPRRVPGRGRRSDRRRRRSRRAP